MSKINTKSHLLYYSKWRACEVPIWIGIPLLGAFSVPEIHTNSFFLFVIGILLTSIHVLTFNDWGGLIRNPNEIERIGQISNVSKLKHHLFTISIISLFISAIIFWILKPSLLYLFFGGFFLSFLYSYPNWHLKDHYFISKVLHLMAGIIQYLLGYMCFSNELSSGIIYALFFSLIFTSGHFFHVAKDKYEDQKANIKTEAVRFGLRTTILFGVLSFFTAHIYCLVMTVTNNFAMTDFIIFSPSIVVHVSTLLNVLKKEPIEQNFILATRKKYRLTYACSALIFFIKNFFYL